MVAPNPPSKQGTDVKPELHTNGVAGVPGSGVSVLPNNTNGLFNGDSLGDLVLGSTNASIVSVLANAAESIPAWGLTPSYRDNLLRAFWPTENMMASAIYEVATRYSALKWTLEGPDRMVTIYQRMLNGVEYGKGWAHMMMKVLIDVFTQDNGGFIQLIRASDSPSSPVISMSHLDAAQCRRTGDRSRPVVYFDWYGQPHIMNWYQVIDYTEMPSPVQRANGAQYCAVTRMLRAAEIMKSISIYKNEKAGGQFERAINLVGGVQRKAIEDAVTAAQQTRTFNTQRYIQPVIVASLDPTAHVSNTVIELASLPETFNEEEWMRWYITQIAMAFGGDYQDFAPLPGRGSIGSSSQSKTLADKSSYKGTAAFIAGVEQFMNFAGVLPEGTIFKYGDQDSAAEAERVTLSLQRAQERQIRIASGEITPIIARQRALDQGDLTQVELAGMGESDNSPDIIAFDVIPTEQRPTQAIPVISPAVQTAPMPNPTGPAMADNGQPNDNINNRPPPSQSQKQ